MTIDLFLGAHGWAVSMLRVAVQGTLGFALIWACCKAASRMSSSIRCWLWWLGCAAMLAGFAVSRPMNLHLLPARAPHATRVTSPLISPAPVMGAGEQTETAMDQTKGMASPSPYPSWLSVVEAAWAVGVLLGAVRLLLGQMSAKLQARQASVVTDADTLALLRETAGRLGVHRLPVVRAVDDEVGPRVIGGLGRTVLVPRRLLCPEAAGDLRLALAHEMAHIRRGDLPLGWIPTMAELVFWFHPLVRYAAREYRQAREEACDVDTLRVTQADPGAYARLLLQFGVRPAPQQLAASGAASSIMALRRRLANLAHGTPRMSAAKRAALALVAMVALALPCVRLVAQQSASTAPAAVPVVRRPHRQPLPPMPVYSVPEFPKNDHALRQELDEAKRAQASITPQERAALRQAIAESRGEAVRARQDAMAEAGKSQAEALAQSAKVRRQLASLHSQEFKRAMAEIDQAHLGKTLSDALKSVPADIDTDEIERHVDAALKNLPKEIDVPEALPSTTQTGQKIVIDHPGRYVIPQGSGVIINIPLHHVAIVGDTMTVD